jgi:hypothetical protein
MKRGCKFHVALRGATAGQEELYTVDTFNGPADQTMTVQAPSFTVTSIALDPFAECLVYLQSSTPRTVRRRAWVSDRAGPFAPID